VKVSIAVEGFILSRTAEGLSPRTLELYQEQLERFALHCTDLGAVTPHDLRRFLAWLRDGYLSPRGKKISRKTLYNNRIALRSFFRWCYAENLVAENPASEVPAPRFESPPPDPFTKAQVETLLEACSGSHVWVELVQRNRAIILVLLDTGIRAGELINLRVAHMDAATGRLTVERGKGGKTRFLYPGKTTRKALWRYLAERGDRDDPAAPIFATLQGKPIALSTLGDLLKTLGQRADVANCHPHRFRHTFGRPFGRLVNSSLDEARHQERVSSPWRPREPSISGLVSFQGT
jgi:integrase/recombinase XerD